MLPLIPHINRLVSGSQTDSGTFSASEVLPLALNAAAACTESMNLNIVCIPGDGIGPEIVAEARKVLDQVALKYGHNISYKDILMGGASILSATIYALGIIS